MMFKKLLKGLLGQNHHSWYYKKHYSSSDYHMPKSYSYKHPSQYGHYHYKKKHHSGSFFSSFFGS
ncbi:hypothetical protein GTHT12_01115 [Geobacillus thermodenitrificans]|jgi:hypothetical protein|nr:hypothetical protein GTHT12_01115 [Geobacillus thermodenitrificans]KQB93467.1 hypothetical protein GEPA3_1609 [Geobacillus sp. PA-3]MEC5186570.1 hypothetical protein [Geobacillus thermodenitrificans]